MIWISPWGNMPTYTIALPAVLPIAYPGASCLPDVFHAVYTPLKTLQIFSDNDFFFFLNTKVEDHVQEGWIRYVCLPPKSLSLKLTGLCLDLI